MSTKNGGVSRPRLPPLSANVCYFLTVPLSPSSANVSIFPTPPPFCCVTFVSVFNTTHSLEDQFIWKTHNYPYVQIGLIKTSIIAFFCQRCENQPDSLNPFVSQCQHLLDLPPPFFSQYQHFPTPPSLLRLLTQFMDSP